MTAGIVGHVRIPTDPGIIDAVSWRPRFPRAAAVAPAIAAEATSLPWWLRVAVVVFLVASVVSDLDIAAGLTSQNAMILAGAAVLVLALVHTGWGGGVGLVLLVVSLPLGNGDVLLVAAAMLGFLVTLTWPLRAATLYVLAIAVWMVAVAVVHPDLHAVVQWGALPLLLILALTGGAIHRLRDQKRADRERIASLARAAAEAREDERRRLAGELHDVVAHNITLSIMLSSLGPRLESRPEVDDHFRKIEAASRAALADLRQLFGVIERSDVTPPAPRPDVIRSLPDTLEHVAENLRRLGHEVTTELSGENRHLPESYRQPLARSISEMAGNAAKYAAHGAPVQLGLVAGEAVVRLWVENRVAAARDEGLSGALGLHRLHEQAHALGGRFQITRPEGRWRAEMSLPLDPADPRTAEPAPPR